MPRGLGANALGILTKCTVSLCIECSLDKDVCTLCDEGYFVAPDGKSCYEPAAIPDFYGIVGRRVVSCIDSVCINCKLNASVCIIYY